MAEPTHENLIEQLIDELSVFGIECTEAQADLLIKDLELVIEKNKVVNLTRIVALRDAVTLHLVDSLVPLGTKAFKPSNRLRFLDRNRCWFSRDSPCYHDRNERSVH